jgi:hypothetical protein
LYRSYIEEIMTDRQSMWDASLNFPIYEGKRMEKVQSVFLLSVMFILLFGSPVWGIAWVELAKTSDGNVLSYDKGSVRTVDNNIYRLWERILYSDNNVKENVKTTIFIREINCRESQYRIISIIDYDANGEKLFSGTDDQTDWSAVPPDTPIDDLRKTVCPKSEKSPIKKLYNDLLP